MLFTIKSTMLPENIEFQFDTNDDHDDGMDEAFESWREQCEAAIEDSPTAEWRLEIEGMDSPQEWLFKAISEQSDLVENAWLLYEAYGNDWGYAGVIMAAYYFREYNADDAASYVNNEDWHVTSNTNEETAYENFAKEIEDDCPEHLECYMDWQQYGVDESTGHVEINGTHFVYKDQS